MLEEKQGQFWNLHRIPNKTSYPDFRFFLLFCCFFQVNSGLKIGVCQISFGSLPKPNIRQFGRIFCRSRIEGLFLPNSTIRQENLNYS